MLKEFIENMGKVLEENGHRRVIPDKERSIYYIKRYSDKLAFYVKVGDMPEDDEKKGNSICIELFFVPIRLPNDEITNTNMGFHINIFGGWKTFGKWKDTNNDDITNERLIVAGKKVVAIENNIGSASALILEELTNPYISTKESDIYREALLVYETVHEDVELHDGLSSLKMKLCEAIKNHNDRQLDELCDKFIDSLTIEYFENRGIKFEMAKVKDYFKGQLKAQCLLDIF